MAAPAQRRQLVLRLYKEILRHARVYPSIRRKEMIEDIRIEFREGKEEKDPKKLHRRLEQAVHGLQMLRQYSSMQSDTEWEIELDPAKMLDELPSESPRS